MSAVTAEALTLTAAQRREPLSSDSLSGLWLMCLEEKFSFLGMGLGSMIAQGVYSARPGFLVFIDVSGCFGHADVLGFRLVGVGRLLNPKP